MDGLADGQITNPRACSFDIDTIGPAGDGSLTAAGARGRQGDVRRHAQRGHRRAALRRREVRLGSRLRSELSPTTAATARSSGITCTARNRLDLDQLARQDQLLETSTTSQAVHLAGHRRAEPGHPGVRRRGGKIVQYHGWNDSVVPPDGSIALLLRADAIREAAATCPSTPSTTQVDKLTPQVVAATGQAFGDQRARIPPPVHAARRGSLRRRHRPQHHRRRVLRAAGRTPRSPKTHVVSAVMKWVEEGVAPEKIVTTRFSGSNIVRQRPVCPYPAQAAYNGSGDINSADSFSCVTPKLVRAPGELDRHPADPELAAATRSQAAESLIRNRSSVYLVLGFRLVS